MQDFESRLDLASLGAARDIERCVEAERSERRAVEISLDAAREALAGAEGEVKDLRDEVAKNSLLASKASSEAKAAREAAEDVDALYQELTRSTADLDLKLRQALGAKEAAVSQTNDLTAQIDELNDAVKRLVSNYGS